MKECSKCGELKSYSEFHKEKKKKDGHKNICKECIKENNTRYYRSIDGLMSQTYHHQIEHSVHPGMQLPTYTQQELKEFCLNDDNFVRIYKEWIDSDYDKLLMPSVDRINDFIGYTLDNIQITTLTYNLRKPKPRYSRTKKEMI